MVWRYSYQHQHMSSIRLVFCLHSISPHKIGDNQTAEHGGQQPRNPVGFYLNINDQESCSGGNIRAGHAANVHLQPAYFFRRNTA